MAENISQFKAGKALLSLLQQHGVKDHGIQQITAVVAQLLDEAKGGLDLMLITKDSGWIFVWFSMLLGLLFTFKAFERMTQLCGCYQP
jgi:hypothetical protein